MEGMVTVSSTANVRIGPGALPGNSFGFWYGKRVFVTGHTGFKGAWLCKLLEAAGAEVTGYALPPPTNPSLFELCMPRMHSVIGDIRNFDMLFEVYRAASPQIVFHMAAQPLVLEGYRQPRNTYETNTMGTVNLLECARLAKGASSILIVTTDKVYRNAERPQGYRESAILGGHDPYSNSKSCAELVTACYSRSFFNDGETAVSTARSGNVIGGGDFSENRIIPDCAKAMVSGREIHIRNPHSVRPYQHVLDTLYAYLLIAQRQYEEPALADCYNVGPDEADCVTSGALADLFCNAWGEGARWKHIPAQTPPESGLLRLDCAKIAKALGWTPRWNIAQAVSAAVEWYRAYGHGDENAVMERQLHEFLK